MLYAYEVIRDVLLDTIVLLNTLMHYHFIKYMIINMYILI